MQKLLFVAKDPGAANVTLPVAYRLQSSFQLYAACEGVAVRRYAESGISFEMVTDDPDHALRKLRPHAVICGLSYPMNIEERFGLAANQLGITLVEIEDFWGGHVRSRAKPDILGTIDEYGYALARKQYPMTNVLVSGSPGVLNALIEPDPAIVRSINQLRRLGCVIVVPLSIDEDVAVMLVRCMERTRQPIVILPLLHPKCVGVHIPKRGITYDNFYRKTLSPYADRVVWISEKIEDIIVSSDALVTGYSTTMFTALQHGRMVASLWTAQTQLMIQATGGIDTLPWFKQGLLYTETPCDLCELLKPTPLRDMLLPFDPEKIISAIESLAKNDTEPLS